MDAVVTAAVGVVGVMLLVYFAVLIGISMDTEGQRSERQRTARDRRACNEERRRLEVLVQRLADERRRAAEVWPCPDCPRRPSSGAAA